MLYLVIEWNAYFWNVFFSFLDKEDFVWNLYGMYMKLTQDSQVCVFKKT